MSVVKGVVKLGMTENVLFRDCGVLNCLEEAISKRRSTRASLSGVWLYIRRCS